MRGKCLKLQTAIEYFNRAFGREKIETNWYLIVMRSPQVRRLVPQSSCFSPNNRLCSKISSCIRTVCPKAFKRLSGPHYLPRAVHQPADTYNLRMGTRL